MQIGNSHSYVNSQLRIRLVTIPVYFDRRTFSL